MTVGELKVGQVVYEVNFLTLKTRIVETIYLGADKNHVKIALTDCAPAEVHIAKTSFEVYPKYSSRSEVVYVSKDKALAELKSKQVSHYLHLREIIDKSTLEANNFFNNYLK